MVASGYFRFPHIVADQVVFTAEDDLWLVSAAGGRASRLTADQVPVSRPRLSPDGSMVAWVSRRRGEPEVFVMPSDGGPARQLTYFGHVTTSVLGFAPDGRLLVCSAGQQPFRSHSWAYAIDLTPGADASPQRLPFGPVNAVSHGPSGAVVVGTGSLRDYAQWKRYRGGTAGRLWLDPDGSGHFDELLAGIPGPKTWPGWVGDRLTFLSDAEGHGNVYSVDSTGGDLRRHTDHDRFYARQLAGDGTRLAYQSSGELWLLDDLSADSQPHPLTVSLTGPRAGQASAEIEPGKHLGRVAVDRTGRASAVEVRGSILWLTHRNGPARVLASTAGVRHRLPVVLAGSEVDGPSVAYVTSRHGADSIEIVAGDGSVRALGQGRLGRVLELIGAPDGSALAVASHDGRLLLAELGDAMANGSIGEIHVTELDRTPHGDISGVAFSPDSRWLAYAIDGATRELRSIRLCERAGGAVSEVTERRFDDSAPAFSRDGKYLAFLSARTFDPVYDAHVFDLGFPLAVRPYLVPLAAGTPSPFDPERDGQPSPGAKPGAGPAPDAAGSSAAEEAGPAVAGGTEPIRIEPIRIDLDGIGRRIVPFPVAAGRLTDLIAVDGGFVWADEPIAGELGESRNPDDDVRPSVQRWDFGKRKRIALAEHADAVAPSLDGTALVLRDGESLTQVPADHKPAEDGSDSVKIDLSRVRLDVQPSAEWSQMLDETARLLSEHFWVPDLGGVDWATEVDKYRPVVERLGTRDDVSDVLWEINGETGASHAYETPPPVEQDPRLAPAFLGADLRRDGDAWMVDRVLPGDNSSRMGRSPLTAPGVDVRPGSRIVAVNGRAVGQDGPAPLLRGSAGKPVELRIALDGAERDVVVTPLAAETQLRYLDWVAARRSLVHRAGEGRIGYVHVPDMMSAGWAAFHRDLRIEVERDALIVDTRDNGGGHTSQLVIEKLARKLVGWNVGRHRLMVSYPEGAPRGPLVSLANEGAGSDGDIVNVAFQSLQLGPVLGTRTWGGVIGIDGRYQLIDGTQVTQPRYSFWFERLGWQVENYGVDPDQVVEFPPHAWGAGSDPQLDAGVSYLLAELRSRPARPMPDLAQRPSRRAPELPPRP